MEHLFNKIEIIFETSDFLAINKPAGLLVHKINANHPEETLVDWLIKKYSKIKEVGENNLRPGIVHRLDRETSGVMIVAKNNISFDYLKDLFQERKIKKQYLALVFGIPKEKMGIINTPIGIIKSSIKRSVQAKGMREIKEAITEYKVLKTFEEDGKYFSLLKILLKTGRTNQIRVHLSSIHHPIVGDNVYAPKSWLPPVGINRMFLHAYSLEFIQSSGQVIRLEADLPIELKMVLDNL